MNTIWDLISGKWFGAVKDAVGWVFTKVVDYQAGQDALAQGKLAVELAELKAKEATAAYRIRADLEWDTKWADGAANSWKDEFLLILWSLPLIGLFIPGLRDIMQTGFNYLRIFSPDAPTWYLTGWGIIFAATFGFRQAVQFMMPGRYAELTKALGSAPKDIPEDAIAAIDARLANTPPQPQPQ